MSTCTIVNFHTKHIADIEEMISERFECVQVVDAFTNTLPIESDFVILTGGSHIPDLYYQKEEYESMLTWIKNTQIPILGICFGCELIAVAFGSTLKDAGYKQVFTQDICFKDKNFCLTVSEAHRFEIDSLSQKIKVLSLGKHNSIEMIQHKYKNIIGVQFHPEMNKESRMFFDYVLGEMKMEV